MWLLARARFPAICVVGLFVTSYVPAAAQGPPASLDQGFRLLYEADFAGARQEFVSYERERPQDPMGPAAEAAYWLFAELHRQGVLGPGLLQSGSRPNIVPDAKTVAGFDSALGCTDAIVSKRLGEKPDDRNALLAATVTSGLRADYAVLIQRHTGAALHYTKDATTYADRLLATCPDCYDAYVAAGITRYIVGTRSLLVRWILGMSGIEGDKRHGIADLRLASERARYMAPFARMVLALIHVREKDVPGARTLLAQLQRDFPRNPLYARAMDRLDNAR